MDHLIPLRNFHLLVSQFLIGFLSSEVVAWVRQLSTGALSLALLDDATGESTVPKLLGCTLEYCLQRIIAKIAQCVPKNALGLDLHSRAAITTRVRYVVPTCLQQQLSIGR